MTNHVHRRALFAGAAGLVLAGCADVVGPPTSPKLFVLEPKFAAVPGPKVAWALAIQTPDATAGLDTERIALTRPPAGLDYYAETAWADRVPLLVQKSLLEAFETSGRIFAVARDSDGARSDVTLSTDIRNFEVRYDQGEAAPLAVVRLGIRLLDARTRSILGSVVIAKEQRASANSVPAAVEAITQALSQVLADLVPWVLVQPVVLR